MRYQHILFDLDGTLIESGPGIFAATRAMMQEMGIADINDEALLPIIGPPLAMGFKTVLGIDEANLQTAIECYRTKAKTVGMDLVKPYPGILELLKTLKERGHFVGIVTSKVITTAREHILRYGIAPYIDYVCGAQPNGIGEKTELLRIACKELNITSGAVMIGDKFYDLDAANALKLDSIGVTYGYGSVEEIEGCHPTYIAHNTQELSDILLCEE